MRRTLLLISLLFSAGQTAWGAVTDVSTSGLAVKNEVIAKVAPKDLYAALLHDVGRWWNARHTYSGDSANLSIDPRPGGCFCEKLPGDGGVEHARVIALIPGSLVRMSGALGPLQASGLVGTLTWKFTQVDGGTKVEMTYFVGGYIQGGLEPVAPAVDGVLRDQLERLKVYAETRKTP
jgi:uncharacterized protein YndB with AHSA1/START domain